METIKKLEKDIGELEIESNLMKNMPKPLSDNPTNEELLIWKEWSSKQSKLTKELKEKGLYNFQLPSLKVKLQTLKNVLKMFRGKREWCIAMKNIRLREVQEKYNMKKEEAMDWVENNKDYEYVQRNSEIYLLEELESKIMGVNHDLNEKEKGK